MSAPTEEHKALAALVGSFDQRTQVNVGQTEPMKAHSVETGRWVVGGRYVEMHSTSAPDEELKGDRTAVYGYDPTLGKYTLWNIDSGSLAATVAVGDYDAATRTFTFDREKDNPTAGRVPFRWTLTIQESGAIAQSMKVRPGGADYMEVVTVTYTPTAPTSK